MPTQHGYDQNLSVKRADSGAQPRYTLDGDAAGREASSVSERYSLRRKYRDLFLVPRQLVTGYLPPKKSGPRQDTFPSSLYLPFMTLSDDALSVLPALLCLVFTAASKMGVTAFSDVFMGF